MKRTTIALFLALSSTGLHADVLKASDLEIACLSSSEIERTLCMLAMRAFMDGFIEGVGKGVLDTYQHDPQVGQRRQGKGLRSSLEEVD